MPRQFDIFDEVHQEEDLSVQKNLATALKLASVTERLSPAQQNFNQLLERIERLNKQQVALKQLCDAHRPRYLQRITLLRRKLHEFQRELALWIDQRLERKGLTAKQRSSATMILCELCCQLVDKGDSDMQTIFDKHSEERFEQQDKMAAAALREAMEEFLGESLLGDETLDSIDDVFQAGLNQMHEAESTRQSAQRARAKKKKLTAKQLKVQDELDEANSTFRLLFRQLASALHPDRESDADERIRKTALMCEVNAAYERRDLVALLQIQLQIQMKSANSTAKMAEEKIVSLNLLLKQQIKDLENQLNMERHQARHDFGLDYYEAVNQTNLSRSMILNTMLIEKDIDLLQRDLQNFADDTYFKRWLKTQNHLMNDDMNESISADWMFEAFKQR